MASGQGISEEDSLGCAEEEDRRTRSEILGLVALGGRTGAFGGGVGVVVLVLLAEGEVVFAFV